MKEKALAELNIPSLVEKENNNIEIALNAVHNKCTGDHNDYSNNAHNLHTNQNLSDEYVSFKRVLCKQK